MGISSSTENLEDFNMRSDQFSWETMGRAKQRALPEKESVQRQAIVEATLERVMRDLYDLFPPKLGESSIDQPKEGDAERDEEVIARFCEFMKGGGCKESFTALVDCVEETDSIVMCSKNIPKLIKCVDAHSDYYQPIIALAESAVEQMAKDVEANFISKEEEPARKHAKRWLRRFW